MRPAPPVKSFPEAPYESLAAPQAGPAAIPELPLAPDEVLQAVSDADPGHDTPLGDVPPDGVLADDGLPYGDPLPGLVQAAVANRPVEDVVRLITLLEGSPEHARTTADALRAVGVDRSVEDLARLVTLLTEAPRDTASADEAIRAAAERRPLDDVSRLMQLLHRTSMGPYCGQAAVRAVAVSRPVEELAELIGRLAADRAVRETPLSGPPSADPSPTDLLNALPQSGVPVSPVTVSAFDAWAAATAGQKAQPAEDRVVEARSVEDRVVEARSVEDRPAEHRVAEDRPAEDRPTEDRPAGDRPAADPPAKEGSAQEGSGRSRSATERLAMERTARNRSAKDGSAKERPTMGRSAEDGLMKARPAKDRDQDGRKSAARLRGARGAALLVLLCGAAHAPRRWAGLSTGILVASVVVTVLWVLMALALPNRAAAARLVAATAAFGVTAALAAGELLGGRFGLPEAPHLWDATLAPSWLAVTAAGVAALAALAVLLGALRPGNARRGAAG
ncbi:hypothetical protein [Streptomyces sp. NPDC001250]|uniref:hypothetical protein n=1 Tax=Streptomyces sp. NPDC001250 TaxID=3154382 RepID=UPI003323D059